MFFDERETYIDVQRQNSGKITYIYRLSECLTYTLSKKTFDIKLPVRCNNPDMLAYGNLDQYQMNRLGKKAFAKFFNFYALHENLLFDIAPVFRNMGLIDDEGYEFDDKYYSQYAEVDSDDENFEYHRATVHCGGHSISLYRNCTFNLTINVAYNNCIYKVTFKFFEEDKLYITDCELVLSYDYLNSREQIFGLRLVSSYVNEKIFRHSDFYNETESIVQMEDGKFFYLFSKRYYIDEHNSFDSYYDRYSYERYVYYYLDNKIVNNFAFELENLNEFSKCNFKDNFNDLINNKISPLIKKSMERNIFNDKFDRYFS